MTPQIGLEQTPGAVQTPAPPQEAKVVTTGASAGAARTLTPDQPLTSGDAVKPKATVTPEVARLDANKLAVQAMFDSTYVKGKGVETYLTTGDASGISAAQMARITKRLDEQGAPAAPKAEIENAPVIGGEAMEPAAMDAPSPEAEAEAAKVENAYATQPAAAGSVKEMNRILDIERGPAVNVQLQQFKDLGVPVRVYDNEPVVSATKGDFSDLKAADQSVGIQNKAQERLANWEGIKADAQGVPLNPVTTVGQAVEKNVATEVAKLKVPAEITEAIKDPEIMALADAARARNTATIRNYQTAVKTAEAESKPKPFEPSAYDYSPRLDKASQFAIAKGGENLTVEGAKADIKTALTAGTNRMLYNIADAQGVKEFRKIEVKLPEAPKPEGAGKPAKDPDWANKPIDSRDAAKLTKAIGEKGFDALPVFAQTKLGGDINKVSELNQGDFSKIRKAGYVESAGNSSGAGKTPFDPAAAASPKTVGQVKEAVEKSFEAIGKLGLAVDLMAKLTELKEGRDTTITKGDVADLRKKNVIA